MISKLIKNTSLRFGLLLLIMGCFSCSNQTRNTSFTQNTGTNNENLPQVVATTSILCDLTKQVAENTVNLICIIPPNTDAQDYQPKSEDRTAIAEAKLVLYNGYNLEPQLIKLIRGTKNSTPKIAVAQIAVPRPRQFQVNGQTVPNPYIWHNPKNAIAMVEVINNNLRKVSPNNSDIYRENTKRIKAELAQIDSWIKSRTASIPENKRKLVTTTNAMDYFSRAYSIPSASFGTEAQGTDQRLNNLVKYVQKSKVPTVFAEATVKPDLIESVASAAGVKLSSRQLYTQGLGEERSNANTYQNMLFANTRTIVEGLGGTYLIFPPRVQQSQP